MKEIRSMEIEPSENGGHTVTHRFKEMPSRNVGMQSYQEPEHHVFGPDEHEDMMAHVAHHLGVKHETGKLDAAKRAVIPKSEFGLPGSRKYPMPDRSHAANAKARATQMVEKGKLSSASAAKIRAKANHMLGGAK